MEKNSGTEDIYIRRKCLFEDSYYAIMNRTSYELKKNLKIKYRDEDGTDAGGLKRFFYHISKELINNKYSLFEYSNENSYLLKIKPKSTNKYLEYYRFVGRLIGMTIFHNQYLAVSFVTPIYKELLNEKLCLKDLKSIDTQLYSNLKWILNNNIKKENGFTFTRVIKQFGIIKTIELKPNGSYIYVTDYNKREYVDLMTENIIKYGVVDQLNALKKGFDEIIPNDILSTFNERDLDLLISGIRKIDIEDWKNNTVYEGYSKYDNTITYFWTCVNEFDDDMRSKLLQFATGNSQVPVTGFKDLQGSDGPRHFKISYQSDERRLPISHTCFNCIDLPPYSTYSILKQKLILAINECETFELS
ncbi:HECT-domain-containing protein [Neocallimastix californiae]|uniref:HECT-type E3 ubiquitin transferase n=1 Tax=Neocallimastix californiae TaxID=1754190 RepID=A0A1Y2C390_9FUNG|nr:HECT-domain-containing protein [Neocallimastix californiae]|eukprot:ORY41489.1 HECT-domain-containing protein [Neocallimastix californiae]